MYKYKIMLKWVKIHMVKCYTFADSSGKITLLRSNCAFSMRKGVNTLYKKYKTNPIDRYN